MNNYQLVQYQAVIERVTPSSYIEKWRTINSCYFGISLGSLTSKNPVLDATIKWIGANFKNCLVAVGDGIYRLTLQITDELPEDKAKSEAYNQGCRFLEENSYLFEEQPNCNFKFVKFSAIQESVEYKHYEDILFTLFTSDPNFAESIRASATPFIYRRRKNKNDSPKIRENMVNLASKYVLEEMAVFACFVNSGYEVEVYPGSELPVLVDIANGLHKNVPEELKKRVNIALKIKSLKV